MGSRFCLFTHHFFGDDRHYLVMAAATAGGTVGHGLIGAGVYASHGYERSHIDGVYNTLKVLSGYLDV